MKITSNLIASLLFANTVKAFVVPSLSNSNVIDSREHATTKLSAVSDEDHGESHESSRRQALHGMMALATATAAVSFSPSGAFAEENMFEPKFVQEYADFERTPEGWSFREVKVGDGSTPNKGDRVVFDWSGYTIGYFGRPFEAKGGPQGGAFDKELDYFRTELGSGKIIRGLDCALASMKPGGIRQVLIPFGELGYPQETDPSHELVGPKPTTFSGQRALNFVLDNPRVDRTLLFNVKLIRVDKPDGKGGFVRGGK